MLIKNKSHIFLIIFLLIFLMVVSWFAYSSISSRSNISSKSPASDSLVGPSGTYYTDIEGNAVDLSTYLGRVLVVTSWASWSPGSVSDLKLLSELSREYPESDVVFLAINRGEPKETASAFLNTLDTNPEVMLVIDRSDVFYSSIGGFSMPETVVFDEKGNIYSHKRGGLNRDEITLAIKALIRG